MEKRTDKSEKTRIFRFKQTVFFEFKTTLSFEFLFKQLLNIFIICSVVINTTGQTYYQISGA